MISIVTVCRDAKNELRKTFFSISTQLKAGDEYIIVDGASTDGTKEFLSLISNSNVKWISEPDTGIYNAMNKGIRLAKGEWIGIVNAGDELCDGALETLRRHLPSEPSVITGLMLVYDGKKISHASLHSSYHLKNHMIEHPSSFVHRDIYQKYGMFDESYRIAGDYDFFSRLYSERVPFIQVPYPMVKYYMGGISMASPKTALEVSRIKIKYGWEKKASRVKLLARAVKEFFQNLRRILF